MIEKIEIEGFKSFGSPGVEVGLGRLNFLVGPNACGKTNFLSALRFLHDCIRQNVEFAVNELGGTSEVRNKIQRQREKPKPLRLRVRLSPDLRLDLPGTSGGQGELLLRTFDYSLSVDLRSEQLAPVIVEESLIADLAAHSKSYRYELSRDAERLRIEDPFPLSPSTEALQEIVVPEQEKARPAVNVGFFSLPAVLFKSLVERWSFYNVSPRIARKPYKEVPDTALGPYGENLAVVLHELGKADGANGRNEIVSALRGIIPGLVDIGTERDGLEGKWALTLKEDRIRGKIPPSGISDGTIRLIALMTIAILGSRNHSTVAIEEPENGVHPHLTEHLVRLIRDKSQDAQFIITTHSPAFLDHADASEVLLCGKEDGFTRIRHASDLSEVESFRKHFSLGDLWVQGTFDQILEGNP